MYYFNFVYILLNNIGTFQLKFKWVFNYKNNMHMIMKVLTIIKY